MAYKMQLWISHMYYALFNDFPEYLHSQCLPLSFKLSQADLEFILELHLCSQCHSIDHSLQQIHNLVQ